MKKIKFLLVNISLFTMGACTYAQDSPKPTVLKTADGKTFPANKLDSLKKSYGGEVNYVHYDEEPGVIYVLAKSSAGQRAAAQSKARFAAMIGKPAPDFQLTDINGKEYDLKKLKGKVVVLNFWFTTCGGCIAEMPYLNKMKEGYKTGQVIFLGLALEKASQIREFKKIHEFDFALIPETMGTAETYGIYTFPVSMVIDGQGVITTIIEFDQPIESLPKAIDAALHTNNDQSGGSEEELRTGAQYKKDRVNGKQRGAKGR